MSRISYCSIEEAWGNNFNYDKDYNKDQDYQQKYNDNIYKKPEQNFNNQLSPIKKNILDENDYDLQNINASNKFILNKNVKNKKNTEENNLEEKIKNLERECNRCREYLRQLKLKKSRKGKIKYIENFNDDYIEIEESYNKKNSIIDIIVLILVGIFIIFILDSLFYFGKQIGKNTNS